MLMGLPSYHASTAMTDLRIPSVAVGILALWLHGTCGLAQVSTQVEPVLGPAPRAPLDVSGLPGKGPRKLDATAAFSVNGNSREQVRQFYNAVYTASDGVPMDSIRHYRELQCRHQLCCLSKCRALRINWFRAMSGVPRPDFFRVRKRRRSIRSAPDVGQQSVDACGNTDSLGVALAPPAPTRPQIPIWPSTSTAPMRSPATFGITERTTLNLATAGGSSIRKPR